MVYDLLLFMTQKVTNCLVLMTKTRLFLCIGKNQMLKTWKNQTVKSDYIIDKNKLKNLIC